MIGPIPSGIPVSVPLFSYSYASTSGTMVTVSTGQMVSAIAAGMIISPIMAYMESISMAKRYSKLDNYRYDSVQELYDEGCN